MPAPTVTAVLETTHDPQVRESMLLGSYLEGGWSPPFGVGDSGHSFGPYQINLPFHPGVTREQAEDPAWSSEFMWSSYVGAMIRVDPRLWITNPEQAAEKTAYFAERPRVIYHENRGQAAVDQAWSATVNALKEAGQPLGPGGAGPGGTSPAGIPGPSGGDVSDACKKALNDVLSGKISKDQCTQICGTPCTSGGYPGSGVVGGITGAIGSVEDAIKFVFSIRFLEVLGGGLLILIAIRMLGGQLAAKA